MAEFTTAFGQDGPEATRPSSAMFLTACAVCAKALNNDEARECENIVKALMDSLYKDPNASVDDLREAVSVFENIPATSSRVLGTAHPDTKTYEKALAKAKKALADKSSA